MTTPIGIARRSAAVAAVAALVTLPAAAARAAAEPPRPQATFEAVPVGAGEFVLGRADAPVTIIEYASLTCPHCAEFHNTVLPEVKKAYIDTGKARLVYRDFPLDRFALAASMLARCAGRERYFGFIELLFKDQTRWANAANPRRALGQLARLGGMSDARFEACLGDESLQNEVLEQRLAASRDLRVKSTPTLIINGRKFEGGLSFGQVRAIIEPMLSES